MGIRNFSLIAGEMASPAFIQMGKAQQKERLDEWISRVLDILETREHPTTDWEKWKLREAISHSRDGLFRLAWQALDTQALRKSRHN